MGELQETAFSRAFTKDHFSHVMDSIPGMIAYTGADLCLIYANKNYAERAGRTVEEIIGKTVREILGEEEFKFIHPYIMRALKGTRQHFYRTRMTNIGERFLEIVYTPDFNENGIVKGYTTFINDLTSMKAAKLAADENDLRFRIISNQTPFLIMMVNEAGECEYMNKPMSDMLGIQQEDQRNITWKKFVHPDDHELSVEKFKTLLKNPEAYSSETRIINIHTDEYRWFLTKGIPRYRPDGSFAGFIITSLDIDEKKRAEEEMILSNKIAEYSLVKREKALQELMETKKKMEEMMRVKEQFISNMSHEIRTPMNAIVGFTDLIMKTTLTAEQKQYTDAIKISGENLLVIINDILDFSKLEADAIRFEKIDFKLSQVLSTMTEMLLPKSTGKNIRFSVNVSRAITDNLIGDPTRLTQVLLNLAGNAVKFTEQGEVKITVEKVSESENETELKFIVADTGIGIPEEKHQVIFEPFMQATNETTRKYGGSGLGLSIVRQFVERQGGKIKLESKEGFGTTFEFILKFGTGATIPVPVTSLLDTYEHENFLVEGLNVLLVEDNELNQLLASKVLTNWKWNVDLAENGLIALEKLKKKNYDIILMDIQLPEMDGYEATRRIRNTFKAPKCNIPIMAMTAHAMPSEERKCYEAGMDGYISKPFSVKVLYSRIITILNSVENSSPAVKRKLTGMRRH
jgi:PAS domain S-box-containing protein